MHTTDSRHEGDVLRRREAVHLVIRFGISLLIVVGLAIAFPFTPLWPGALGTSSASPGGGQSADTSTQSSDSSQPPVSQLTAQPQVPQTVVVTQSVTTTMPATTVRTKTEPATITSSRTVEITSTKTKTATTTTTTTIPPTSTTTTTRPDPITLCHGVFSDGSGGVNGVRVTHSTGSASGTVNWANPNDSSIGLWGVDVINVATQGNNWKNAQWTLVGADTATVSSFTGSPSDRTVGAWVPVPGEVVQANVIAYRYDCTIISGSPVVFTW